MTLAVAVAACDPGGGEEGEEDAMGETSADGRKGWFEIGWGEYDFAEVVDGGELNIVWGAQGSAMYPMPVRGGEFGLAPDPKDYSDDRAPILDLELDVEGTEDSLCGHFKCVANYPITFDILPDGSYEFIYVRVIVPDDVDPTTLQGRAAHLWVQLDPYDSEPHEVEYDFTLNVDPPPF